MKTEKLLRCMGQIDEDLIADAMAQPKRARAGWVRWVAAAACLCLVLASPVGAEMLGRLEELRRETFTSYASPERLTLDSLSKEAKAAARDQEHSHSHYPLDSIEDAEAFLGLDLPENTVLDSARKLEFDTTTSYGESFRSHCIVGLQTNDENVVVGVDAEFSYRIGTHQSMVWYRIATEEVPFETSAGIAIETDDTRREEYVTASGLECVLHVEYTGDPFWGWEGYAFTVVDGYLAYIEVHGASQLETMEFLKTILEGYG